MITKEPGKPPNGTPSFPTSSHKIFFISIDGNKMETKRKSHTSARRDGVPMPSLTRVGWLTLMLAFATRATAFNSRSQLAMLTSRKSVRDNSRESYEGQTTTPFPNSRRTESLSTRLQYKDGNDDSNSPKSIISYRWWSNLFSSSAKSESVGTEQDNVDEYLEFLDRRYRRLHSEDEKEEQKPFSALNWLLQGSSDEDELIASRQQQEDALYVLGVAGLASQKLLQKHPQISLNNEDSSQASIEAMSSPVIDALDALDASVEESTSFRQMMVRKVLVPVVKLLYLVDRRKQMFVNVQAKRVRGLMKSVVRSTARTLVYGPMTAAKVFLKVGGGKRNVLSTFTFASTIVLLTRPVLQAMLNEKSVNP